MLGSLSGPARNISPLLESELSSVRRGSLCNHCGTLGPVVVVYHPPGPDNILYYEDFKTV